MHAKSTRQERLEAQNSKLQNHPKADIELFGADREGGTIVRCPDRVDASART